MSDSTSSPTTTSDGASRRRWRRREVLLLTAIATVGLLRGGYWALTVEVFSPVDELQHLAYAVDLARGDGLPVAGEDVVPRDLLVLVKESHTGVHRSSPGWTVPEGTAFGLGGQQYEGAQPPLFYLLVAPAWALSQAVGGTLTGIFAVRLATVLVSLLAVPLLFLLSRELFPGRRTIAFGAPALLVLVHGFNANLATVTNDALVPAAGVAALLPAAMAWRRGPSVRLGLWMGVAAGAAVLVKTNLIAVIPLAVLLGLDAVRRHREVGWSDLLRWLGAAALAGGLTLAPWMIWNLVQYGEPSGAAVVHEMIMEPLQPPFVGSWKRVLYNHMRNAIGAYWTGQLSFVTFSHPYRWILFGALYALGTVAVVRCWRRGRRDRAIAQAVVTAAHPVTFVVLLAIIFGTLGGSSITVGRLLYPSLALAVLAIAAGAILLLGPRWGLVGLSMLALALLWFERPLPREYVDRVYAQPGVVGDLVPVIEQDWTAEWQPPTGFAVDLPDCAVEAVSVLYREPPHEVLPVTIDGDRVQAELVAQRPSLAGTFATYRLPDVATSSLEVRPVAELGWSPFEREHAFDVPTRPGDPVASVLCPVDDPSATRFAQRFPPEHLDALRYPLHTVWADGWFALGLGALLTSASAASGRGPWRRDRD